MMNINIKTQWGVHMPVLNGSVIQKPHFHYLQIVKAIFWLNLLVKYWTGDEPVTEIFNNIHNFCPFQKQLQHT